MRSILLVVACLSGALACGGGGNQQGTKRDSLTERQRDTAISKSGIPGASGVGKAMRVADSTSAQVRSSDSVQ